MTVDEDVGNDAMKFEKFLPVKGIWADVFRQVLTVSIVAVVLAAILASFIGASVVVYAACLKWTFPGTFLLTVVLRRHHLMDWFDSVWKRNIVGYSLVVDKENLKRRIVYNSELRAFRRDINPCTQPTCLLASLNGWKDPFGAWKVSFAGLDCGPMIYLTWGSDRIKVSPEWALLNYDHAATISTVVSGMEHLRREIRQEQKWRYEGEERQTELRMKLDTASQELKKLRSRLTASHYLHLQVLAQLKDTSRLGKSKEGAIIRSTLAKSLKQLVEEGDEMYPAIKLECNKPVEPPVRAS